MRCKNLLVSEAFAKAKTGSPSGPAVKASSLIFAVRRVLLSRDEPIGRCSSNCELLDMRIVAIDWDYENDTFHNGWQLFRMRKQRKLGLKATHVYEEPGQYKILVKLDDIFGNDTTKLVEVRV